MQKIKILIIVISGLITISCTNQNVEIEQNIIPNKIISQIDKIDYKNGYYTFDNQEELLSYYNLLSSFTEEELHEWGKLSPFITLEEKYNQEGSNRYLHDPDDESNIIINTKRVSPALASLLNEKGILMINDTIIKVQDEYVYYAINKSSLSSSHFDTIRNEDVMRKTKHTTILNNKLAQSNDMLKVAKDQSPIFYTDKNVRQFMDFRGYIEVVGLLHIFNAEMISRWQKKVVVWLTPTNSPMVYGQIKANGYITDLTNPPYKISVLYDSQTMYGLEKLRFYAIVGAKPEGARDFNINIQYIYKRTNSVAYLSGWKKGSPVSTEGSFTYVYSGRDAVTYY